MYDEVKLNRHGVFTEILGDVGSRHAAASNITDTGQLRYAPFSRKKLGRVIGRYMGGCDDAKVPGLLKIVPARSSGWLLGGEATPIPFRYVFNTHLKNNQFRDTSASVPLKFRDKEKHREGRAIKMLSPR